MMVLRTKALKALVAFTMSFGAALAFAQTTTYDFSTVDGQSTAAPVTIGPATFSSTGGTFLFSPNTGLYTSFASEVLSEAGVGGATLNISFAAAQSSVQFDFSLGDFFAGGGNDTLTITTNTGAILSATAALSTNGDFYPEGTFIYSGGPAITSLAITSGAPYPITIADMVSVAAVPEPTSWALMGAGLAAVLVLVRNRRAARPAV